MSKFYVTEDIAKKLQAKGYPHSHIIHFDNGVPIARIDEVLDWLREEKKIHIRPSVYFIGWCYDITMTEGKYSRLHGTECEYYSYEEATLAGIEYCVDNLI